MLTVCSAVCTMILQLDSFIIGLHASLSSLLQSILHVAAKVIFLRHRAEHITLMLENFQQLPIASKIKDITLIVAFKALQNLTLVQHFSFISCYSLLCKLNKTSPINIHSLSRRIYCLFISSFQNLYLLSRFSSDATLYSLPLVYIYLMV